MSQAKTRAGIYRAVKEGRRVPKGATTLTPSKLKINKQGRIVSRIKSMQAKKRANDPNSIIYHMSKARKMRLKEFVFKGQTYRRKNDNSIIYKKV